MSKKTLLIASHNKTLKEIISKSGKKGLKDFLSGFDSFSLINYSFTKNEKDFTFIDNVCECLKDSKLNCEFILIQNNLDMFNINCHLLNKIGLNPEDIKFFINKFSPDYGPHYANVGSNYAKKNISEYSSLVDFGSKNNFKINYLPENLKNFSNHFHMTGDIGLFYGCYNKMKLSCIGFRLYYLAEKDSEYLRFEHRKEIQYCFNNLEVGIKKIEETNRNLTYLKENFENLIEFFH